MAYPFHINHLIPKVNTMKTIHILEGCILCAALLLATNSPCWANSTQLSFNLTAPGSPNIVSNGAGSAEFVSGDLVVDVSFTSGPVTSTSVSCFDFGCVPTDISYGAGGQIDIGVSIGGQFSAQFVGTFVSTDESISYFENGDIFGDDIGGTFVLDGFKGFGQLSLIHTNHTSGELDSATLTYTGTATPEPGSLALMCIGMLAAVPLFRHRALRI
jgi:PEP-CTERM motif-containing protein